MPPAEVEIDARLVRRLITEQFPEWSGFALRRVPTIGWDNALFRLGRGLVVRIPRRQLGADLVAIEQRWLGPIAARLPLPAPAPVAVGRAGAGYPWAWSVCPWLPGRMAATAHRLSGDAVARQLAAVLVALHVEAPREAPVHPFGRGRSVAARDEQVRGLIAQWPVLRERPTLARAWDLAVSAPDWHGPDLWVHGDLHPANLLVSRGRLSAVLDFGDLCAGDPAVDLISAWMLLPPSSRDVLRVEAHVDPATWDRGRGWALALCLAILERSSDNEVLASIGERGLGAVIDEMVSAAT